MTVHPTALRRAMGLRTIVSTSTGLAFAAIEYLAVAGLLTAIAGRLAWLAILVAGGFVLLAWGYFSELCGIFPTAAAIRRYMQAAMEDHLALTITFTYMTSIILVMAADAYIVGSAIAHSLGEPGWLVSVYIVLLLGAATFSNLKGVKVAGAVEDISTYLILLVTAVVAIAACAHHSTPVARALDATRPSTVGGFVQAVALGVLLYSAFEWVTTSAEEVRQPRQIHIGMLVSLGILATTCAVLSYGMSHLLAKNELDSAFPQLYLGRHVAGGFGYAVMAIITGLTALNTFNGGFITASRFIYATAREGALPRVAARLNDNFVPWVPVVGLAVSSLAVSLVVSITHSWQVILSVGASLESMIYAVAGYCVWRIRKRQPETHRPFRVWWAPVLTWVGIVIFGLLALIAGVSVDNAFDVRPLIILACVGGLCAVYVLVYVPRLKAAELARSAAAPKRRRPAAALADAVPAEEV